MFLGNLLEVIWIKLFVINCIQDIVQLFFVESEEEFIQVVEKIIVANIAE